MAEIVRMRKEEGGKGGTGGKGGKGVYLINLSNDI